MSFHREQATAKNGVTYNAGDVVRMNDFGAFSDNVILGFDEKDNVLVSRPYLYASSVGTTGPVPLLGAETYSLPLEHIALYFKRMGTGRTT